MYEWTPANIRLISEDCLSTCEFQEEASEPLRPLLWKYEILGRQLNELAQILEKSGRSHQTYQDEGLDRHVQEAVEDLTRHFRRNQHSSSLFGRFSSRALNANRIAKLEHQAIEHTRAVQDFKIGFLLDTRFGNYSTEERQHDGKAVQSSEMNSLQIQPPPRRQSHSESVTEQLVTSQDDTTTSLVDDVHHALRLARVVWKGRADIVNKKRIRTSSSDSHSSAKQQYIADVARLIENAGLYTKDVDMLDESLRRALEEIVLRTVELQTEQTPPTISVTTEDLRPPVWPLSPSFGSVSNKSDTVSDTAERRSSSINGPRFDLLGSANTRWVKISCSQLSLPPTVATLNIDEAGGEIHIEAIVIPQSIKRLSVGDSDSSRRRSSLATSFDGSSRQDSARSVYTVDLKHFLKMEHRSIPSIKHPNYEGPGKSLPEEPYAITFREGQLVVEKDSPDEPKLVGDLKYIFSHKDYRDEVRALMFGKTLLASAGAAKIIFSHIACTRQSVSLWYDAKAKCYTITFLQQHPDRWHEDTREVEYEIIGIVESRGTVEFPKPIILDVKPQLVQGSRRQCSLFFSDASGRQAFLDILSP